MPDGGEPRAIVFAGTNGDAVGGANGGEEHSAASRHSVRTL